MRVEEGVILQCQAEGRVACAALFRYSTSSDLPVLAQGRAENLFLISSTSRRMSCHEVLVLPSCLQPLTLGRCRLVRELLRPWHGMLAKGVFEQADV